MANKRLITKLVFRDGGPSANVGEEFRGRMVETISFRRDTHQTTGSSGEPCYVVKFVNETVQIVVPRNSAKYVLTDKNVPGAEEDGADVPELPDDEEG